MVTRYESIEQAARAAREALQQTKMPVAGDTLLALVNQRAALALLVETVTRSERERALVRMTASRTASFISRQEDMVALHLNGNGMDDLLSELDRTHPLPAEASREERSKT